MNPFFTSLITTVLLFHSICSIAQGQLDKTIQLPQTNLSLSEIIKAVEEQSSMHFSYDPKRISSQLAIGLHQTAMTLKQILSHLREKHGIQYTLHGSTIILQKLKSQSKTSATLSGVIRDKSNGETLPGAVVILDNGTGTSANRYGFYSVTQAAQTKAIIRVSYLGYMTTNFSFAFAEDSIADLLIEPEAMNLATVEVIGNTDEDLQRSYSSGVHNLNMTQVKSIATMGGEPDPLKALQFLPGVQTGNEGTTNFSVRGGSHDQNLFLLDEAPVYNPSHALSFFSVFNADAVQGITLYKSAIPARYGGRLSSVVDVQMREGNRKKRTISGTVGTIASRITVEGPVSKDERISYIVSGRQCYAGTVLNADMLVTGTKPTEKINFYDINAKINYRKSDKDHFYLSVYSGHDNFYSYLLTSGYTLNWGNKTGTFRWNHIFNPRLFSNTTLLYSDYKYQYNLLNNSRIYDWTARMQEGDIKQDYDYYINPKNHLSFGWGWENRVINPGQILSSNGKSTVQPFRLEKQNSLSGSVYLQDVYAPSEKIYAGIGIRYANFAVLGPYTKYSFAPGEDTPYDSVAYSKKKVVQTFHRIEPRAWLTYTITSNKSLTLSYDRTNQFLHLLSNSSVGMPTDIWMPSSGNIKPQFANIYVLSYQNLWTNHGVEARVATYYKTLGNVLDFKDNANLIVNPYMESQLLQGTGEAYGAEFFVEKKKGKFQGSLSYTLSKTTTTIEGINEGKPFPSRYDKRHNLATIFSMKWSKRLETTLNFVYTTGGAFTVPMGNFFFSSQYMSSFNNQFTTEMPYTYFTSRNGYRMPDYHRLDIGLRYSGKKNETRKWKNWWTLDVYNVYMRKNPFSIYSELGRSNDGSQFNAYGNKIKMIYIYSIVPTISYNFSF